MRGSQFESDQVGLSVQVGALLFTTECLTKSFSLFLTTSDVLLAEQQNIVLLM